MSAPFASRPRRHARSPRPKQAMLAEFAALAEHELNLVDLIHSQRELIETKDALLRTQEHLAAELAEAAAYIRSLLPPKLRGPIRTDWAFMASSQLGGDMFGYHWLDDRHLAIYLHDVCGHGVGASLLSIAVYDVLRRQSLAEVRFHDPAEVLSGLNRRLSRWSNTTTSSSRSGTAFLTWRRARFATRVPDIRPL